tara:strand:- start:591 stop:1349 length:759 start_codon:yes stop_codon:yes gene_type:complete
MDAEVDKWASRYPHLRECIPRVTHLVGALRENPQAEFEARFGLVDARNRFQTGVSRDDIDRVLDMMQSSSHITGESEWTEEQDFFFQGADGDMHRTRVRYTSEDMQVRAQTIKKHDLGQETFQVFYGAENAGCDMRVSLKMEEPIVRMQTCVKTTLVRIKQRRRFTTADALWAFDFAMLWSGASKTEAEQMQAASDPQFEIECELIDPVKALAVHSDARIAISLLLKMCDLLPPVQSVATVRVERVPARTTG